MITFNRIGKLGRLGNQLFQYATLLGIAHKKNYEYGIPLKNENISPVSLDLHTNKWIEYGLDIHKYFNLSSQDSSNYENIKYIYKEKEYFVYNEEIFNISDFTDIEGFFQNEKYFIDIKDIIINEFTPKEQIKEKCISEISNYKQDGYKLVSIHIRRGDYLGLPLMLSVCDTEYYTNAINIFNDGTYKFIIFSDDIKYCKELFGEEDENLIYSNSERDIEDLYKMSLCDHNIIANSSFSWWGAWLNKNENKKVICPNNPHPEHNDKDFFPTEWTRI